MTEHPETDYDTVHERIFDEVDDVYQTLQDALVEDKPLDEALETVLLHSQLIEVEVRNRLKSHTREIVKCRNLRTK
jgi:hypothetical protein